jgi:hypothetical protein
LTTPPGTAAGVHPLQPTSLQNAVLAGGVLVGHIGSGLPSQRGNAGMRVHREPEAGFNRCIEVVQKDKRFELLAQVGRANQPCNRAVEMARFQVGNLAQCDLGGCQEWALREIEESEHCICCTGKDK